MFVPFEDEVGMDLVGDDEHLFAREEAGKHRARLVENAMAKDDVLGVRRALEGGANERS